MLFTEEFQVKTEKKPLIFHNIWMFINRAQLIAFLMDIKFAEIHGIVKIPYKACSQGERPTSYLYHITHITLSYLRYGCIWGV